MLPFRTGRKKNMKVTYISTIMGWWIWACIIAPSWAFGMAQICASCEGGFLAVALSHAAVVTYEIRRIRRRRRPWTPHDENQLRTQIRSHLSRLEGFLLLACYLAGTWYLRMLPPSYYETHGRGVHFHVVICQLVVQDFSQYVMHRLQHRLKLASHQSHHRHHVPAFWDSFDGSTCDTCLMILLPLWTTTRVVPWCNVYDYMCFGCVYANWLCLIHSDAGPHTWDATFQTYRLGTPRDHHEHHRYPNRNFGHLFLGWP